MKSGHDTTLTVLEMFFIKYFGLKFEEFEYPKFCSQISYEITRDEIDKKRNILIIKFHIISMIKFC